MGRPRHPRADLALTSAYRRSGADPPFGDPRRAHGIGLEGYYWRFAGAGWSVAVIAGVCRDDQGGTWAMVTLAGATQRTAVAPEAYADPHRLGVRAGTLIHADAHRLEVDLGPGARLSAAFGDRHDWPRRAWGALGPAQAVPHLGQYWTPHLLGARTTGSVTLDGETHSLAGAATYAEKNWGGVFAPHWWWGHLPLDAGAGAAFAGGRLTRAGVTVAPTAVVAWTPTGLVRLAPPLARTTASAAGGEWRVRARSARTSIELEGEATGPPLRLPVPIPAERRLELRSNHHLTARAQLTVRRGRRVWLRGETAVAALEEGR